ncbi:MAG: hypothetical protein RL299_2133 [Pseudomonadota bacterium]|jgi:hypothetical protein
MKTIIALAASSALLLTASSAFAADGPSYTTYAECAAVAAIYEDGYKIPSQKAKKPNAEAHYKNARLSLTRQGVEKAKAKVGKDKAVEEVNIMIIRFVTYYMGDMANRFQPQVAHCGKIGMITIAP